MSQDNNVEQMGFGYIDDTSDDLRSKAGGEFGLNQGAFLTKFELNTSAGANNSEGDAIDINIQVLEKQYMSRIYPVTKVFDKDRNVIEDKTSDAYKKGYNEVWKQSSAVITHILKCFVTEETLKKALSVPITSFRQYAEIVTSLLPDDFSNKPLDLFLEFQYSIKEGEDRTYLQVPKNMKGGYFVVPQQAGKWKADRQDGALKYREATNGTVHPFERDKKFMESPKSHMLSTGAGAADAVLNNAGGTQTAEGTW